MKQIIEPERIGELLLKNQTITKTTFQIKSITINLFQQDVLKYNSSFIDLIKNTMSRNNKSLFEEGGFYLIYNKVVSEITLFKSQHDYTDFLIRYTKYLSPYFDTFAYCLIPNHFHFLVRVKSNVDQVIENEKTKISIKYINGEVPLNSVLENQLSRMLSGVSLRYNSKYKRQGPLFKQGTKRVLLKNEVRIANLLCYIHHNPIHHKLSSSYSDWKYSSYQSYLSNTKSKLDKLTVLELIGGIDIFHQLHDEYFDYYKSKVESSS